MHIFVSYSKKNKDYAQLLKAKLLSEGFDVWIDDRIDYGDDWWRTIVQAIRKASAFVVIMTDEADASEWVQREVTLADKYKIPPFPLWLSGDFDKSDNWAIYIRTQFADVRDNNLPSDDFYERLAKSSPRKPRIGVDVTPPADSRPRYRRPIFVSGFLILVAIILIATILPSRSPNATPTPPPYSPTSADPDRAATQTNQTQVARQQADFAATNIVETDVAAKQLVTRQANLVATNAVETQAAQLQLSTHESNLVGTYAIYTRTAEAQLATQQANSTEANEGDLTPVGFMPILSNSDWKPVYQTFDGIEMALVPVGCFMMGSVTGNDDEKEVHEQCFDTPFWIDRYEITNQQYGSIGIFSGDMRPRDSVTWFEARDFCATLSARLPTEREWEYIARGPDNLLYPWGTDFIGTNVVHVDNSGDESNDVGSRHAGDSWVGVSDLAGNLWEWVSSLYQPYPYEGDDGRENLDGTDSRVVRGGSWGREDALMSSTIRSMTNPGEVNNEFGFRCARDY